ncbi:MAG: HEAT repeat domain-containing protein [Pyrinomonadaceae bacterium]
MKSLFTYNPKAIRLLLIVTTLVINVAAQPSLAEKEKEFVDGSGDRLWYTMAFVVFASLAAAFYLWRRSKKGANQPQIKDGNRYRDYYTSESYNIEGVDAEKELEWLRKAKKSGAASQSKLTFGVKAGAAGRKVKVAPSKSAGSDETNPDIKMFQEKMRKLQYAQLPINSFSHLTPSKKFEILPVSDDPSLLNAIEQASEEFEEDESIRDLSVKILTAFRTQNSVDALTQIALYDLSSNLRSKAVSTLTDFDHESVFEAILLACADPTREVRAAAARGLFRLNFDRSDAWKRIIETEDSFRMRHAARAAIEAGIAGKAFERLVHEDLKVSYEAFVLVALLIKSGETEELFEAIKTHKDERVKFALLHVLKSIKDERSLSGLNNLRTGHTFPTDVTERIMDTIKVVEERADRVDASWHR